MFNFIGRKFEKNIVENLISHKKNGAFLIGIKGIRRVGKTTFIENFIKTSNYCNNSGSLFVIKLIGQKEGSTEENLNNVKTIIDFKILELDGILNKKERKNFRDKLKEINNWLGVFVFLSSFFNFLKERDQNLKIVLFLDEICWFSKKDNFKTQFQAAWNSYLTHNQDLICFIAGSKISWMNDNFFKNTKEFFGRIDLGIELKPFSLKEISLYLRSLTSYNINYEDIINYYSLFGGIIKYYNFLDFSKSYEWNVDNLLNNKNISIMMEQEKNVLFDSLFSEKKNLNCLSIVEELCKSKSLNKNDLMAKTKLSETTIYKTLDELKLNEIVVEDDKSKNKIYSINSNFCYFYFYWKNKHFQFNSADYDNWKGTAFEILIFNQINNILDLENENKIIKTLNIRTTIGNKNKQLDLVLKNDINDNFFIIETKNYNNEWVISNNEYDDLVEKFVSLPEKNKKIIIITKNGARFSKNISNNKDFLFIKLTQWVENNTFC